MKNMIFTFAYVMFSLLLVGCSDDRPSEQKAIEKDVLEFAKAIAVSRDGTRKSAEAANLAEKKLEGLKERKFEKWTCIQTGGACTTNKKKIEYKISIYPDNLISLKTYEGDKVTFTGVVRKINTNFDDATVWVVLNAESDVVVTAK